MNTELTEKYGWRCLTGNSMKLIGISLMVLDHLHQMFYMNGAPDWFTWLGRLVAPIFLFLCAEGFFYTRSKFRYMLLLFIGFEFMNVASQILTSLAPNDDVMLINNIFGTLFLCTFYMLLTDMLRNGVRAKRPGKVALSVLLMLIPVGIGIGVVALLSAPDLMMLMDRRFFFLIGMIPNLATTEGGFALVLTGLLFYIFREKRLVQILALAAVAFLSLLIAGGVQWMMVFAAIPILLYNGARGKGSKYFFYIFYPAHIYLFYIIAFLIR
jgi:hypothetical protein